MRVWVDCTAAAHPLVLRPIIERLEAEGHEVSVTAREYGQTVGILERLGIASRGRSAATRGRETAPRRPPSARAPSRSARWARPQRFDLALATARSTSPSSRRCSGSPRCRCRTTSSRASSASSRSAPPRRVLVPDAIPLEAMRRAGATAAKLFRYPGLKEDYYLPTSSRTRRSSTSSGSTGERVDRGGPPAAGELRLPRREPGLRGLIDACGRRRAQAVVIPRTEASATRCARAGRRAPDRPRAGDRRPEPDRLRRPRGGGGRDDEPRGGGVGDPVWTLFSGRMGAVDEALISAGRLRRPRDPGRSSCASEPSRSASASLATRSSGRRESWRRRGR